MPDRHFDVAIVGGGLGGAHAALALRQVGFEGSIGIIGDEPEAPYDRPPLSKEYLAGTKEWKRMLIRPPHVWESRGVDLLPGSRAEELDPESKELSLANGNAIGFDRLIWAAGGSARRLTCPGANDMSVLTVRMRADVDAIRARLPGVSNVIIIGAGYIGLEAAAVLAGMGKQVTVLEAQDRVLSRVTGEALARFFEDEHRQQGVDLHLGVTVDCIEPSRSGSTIVNLADGRSLETQLVIAGIGIEPNVGPLRRAGAECGNGVRVDEACRTSLPGVHAIGDSAEFRSPWADGDWTRLESVQNAKDMAVTAAGAIAGDPKPLDAVPWFWSDQYDLKLQTVGLSARHDEVLVRGKIESRSFSLVYLRHGRVIALDCVNRPGDFLRGRKLMAAGGIADRTKLADASVALDAAVAE